MKQNIPLACNMDVFTPAQRDLHIQGTVRLMQSVQGIQEAENGYEFTLANETELIHKVAEFISNERLCCPFLNFTLHVNSLGEPISLSLTGPVGTQDFLRAEFHGAFQ
jgi:hypothetical protein